MFSVGLCFNLNSTNLRFRMNSTLIWALILHKVQYKLSESIPQGVAKIPTTPH